MIFREGIEHCTVQRGQNELSLPATILPPAPYHKYNKRQQWFTLNE